MALCAVAEGDICTVIDEGVLNTDSSKEVRRFLLEKCRLLAVVQLPDETFKPNKINVKASVLYLKRREHDDVDFEDDYKVTFCAVASLGYDGAGDTLRGFDFQRLISEISASIFNTDFEERSGYNWKAFNVPAQNIVQDAACRIDYKYWQPAIRQHIANLENSSGMTIRQLNTIPTTRGRSPSEENYVDEQDGYALVIKAGSNISRYGELITGGDYIEKNLYDEMITARVQNGDVLLSSTGEGTLGKCCVYRSNKPAIADTHVTIIRPDLTKIYPEYLCDYLRVGFGAKQIERLFSGSTGLIELTPDHVNSVMINLLSSQDEQKTVSQALRSQETLYIEQTEQASKSLAEARNSFSAL